MTAALSQRCVIVAGMHRSGASPIAHLLARAGFHLGDDFAGGGEPGDALFEDREIVAFHDALLARNGTEWNRVTERDVLAVPDDLRAAAVAMLERKFGGRAAWGFKDPRASLFLDFWRDAVPQAKWILAVRDPAQVAWSLSRRALHWRRQRHWRRLVGPALSVLALWTTYNRRLLTFAERHPRDVVVVGLPFDLEEAARPALDAALRGWGVGIDALPYEQVWASSLLGARVPLWLALAARWHAPSRALWRRALGARRHAAGPPAAPAPGGRTAGADASADGRGRRPVVCVVRPSRSAYSETFVEAHIGRLPADVKVLHGGYFPQFTHDDRPLLRGGARAVALLREKVLAASRRPLERRALARWLRKERIDVVLAEFGQTGAEIWEACADAGVPLVVHFHGGDAVREKWRRIYGEAYRRMFRSVAGLVVVSRQTEEALVALGAPRDRLVYNPCGADTALFTPADPAAAPPHFLAVNRFVDKKAPHLTVSAFQKVVAAFPEARLTMIGDGPLLEACRQLALALGLERAVEFLGARPHVDVAAAMGRARAVVLHSVTTSDGDVEGTPVSVLEAGAAGLPVIGTRHAGIADVVVDGETGLLVEERDVDGMADAMLALARDPALAAALGRRARERVAEHFSLDHSIARLWEAIEAARRRAAAPAGAPAPGALAETALRR